MAAGEINTQLTIELPDGFKVNDLAPASFEWRANGEAEILASYQEVAPQFPIQLPLTINADSTSLQADTIIYYCDEEAESLCFIERLRVQLPIVVEDGGETAVEIIHTISAPEGE